MPLARMQDRSSCWPVGMQNSLVSASKIPTKRNLANLRTRTRNNKNSKRRIHRSSQKSPGLDQVPTKIGTKRMHPARKLLANIVANNVGTGPIKGLTDEKLIAEWHNWNNKIINATSWGAALGAAYELRTECARELRRRNIPIPTPMKA